MLFQVRSAAKGDSQRISEIATATFALACPPNTPVEELDSYIQGNLLPAHFEALLGNELKQVRALWSGAEVIGYSLVSLAPEPLGIDAADNIAELTRCYVLAASHGSGAAQYLIERTLAGVDGPIRLTVNDSNARAIRFYQRNGFEVVGETSFICGQDVHRDWVMLRR